TFGIKISKKAKIRKYLFSFISVFSSFAIINIIAIIMAARLYIGKELGKTEKKDKSIKIRYKIGRYFADCIVF
ncbi:MAG TPA: hypothetical protein VJB89_00300, partial [Candidatus Nanoarchaeia archaeon]|nr:hypothetical protein [Candidatus Nanoarchaeia archaeon]